MFSKASLAHAGFGMLNIAIPLIIGMTIHNYWLGVMGAFGSLIFMYYVPVNRERTFTQMVLVTGISIVSFPISALSSSIPWISVLWIGLLAYLIQYTLTSGKFIGPGAFFLMMINGMIASLNRFPLHFTLMLAVYAIIGALLSFLFSIIEPKLMGQPLSMQLNLTFEADNLQIAVKSLVYAIFAFIAYFIGYSLHLPNYYWFLVGAISVLQGENFVHARKRQFDYVIAAIVGCLFAWVVYEVVGNPIILAIIAILLLGVICLTINRNYMIGNFFTTPIALILFKLALPHISNSLIEFRLLAIVVGTTIGLLGIIYFDHLMKKQKTFNFKDYEIN